MSPAKTLDDLADEFLAGPSYRTTHLGLPPQKAPTRPSAADSAAAPTGGPERLRRLVRRRAWRDAAALARGLLSASGGPHAPLYEALLQGGGRQGLTGALALETHQRELVLILRWYLRAMVKLGSYRELVLEVERWSFCHHNDNTAPDWIPWSLHIEAASTLQYVPEAQDSGGGGGGTAALDAAAQAHRSCLDALWAIRADIPANDRPVDALRVENALANAFVARREWRMALACHQRMLELLPAACRGEAAGLLRRRRGERLSADAAVVERVLRGACRAELLSRQGRVLLQAGASEAAEEILERAGAAWTAELDDSSKDVLSDHPAVRHVPSLLSANEGLLEFSRGNYEGALERFRSTVEYLRSAAPPQPEDSDDEADDDEEEEGAASAATALLTAASRGSLYAEAVNNMSLSALYTCRLRDALDLLESLVREDAGRYLTDRVALNLCTLYELASPESAQAARRKRVLQTVAKRFSLHDIPPECFRVG